MADALTSDRIPCPACGGAGGGPIGRAGSAWDDEDYVCFKCEGVGAISVAADPGGESATPSVRPGIVKAVPEAPAVETHPKKRKASA